MCSVKGKTKPTISKSGENKFYSVTTDSKGKSWTPFFVLKWLGASKGEWGPEEQSLSQGSENLWRIGQSKWD